MLSSFIDRLRDRYVRSNKKAMVTPAPMQPTAIEMKDIPSEARNLNALAQRLNDAFPDCRDVVTAMMAGYETFVRTGDTPREAYLAFRQLYWQSRGRSNAMIGDHVSHVFPAGVALPLVRSLLGDFTAEDVDAIVGELSQNGFHRFARRLPATLVHSIKEQMDTKALKGHADDITQAPNLGRTTFSETCLLNIEEILQLSADPLLIAIGELYLKTPPILGYVNSWISRPHDNQLEAMDRAAQLFHFDMSNPGFLKVFIYLTDVGEDNGPHCMVPQSHRRREDRLWRDGRIGDEEIASAYPADSWAVLPGQAGSIFMVDTSAFHKGMPVIAGERHILELYYVNTLFGESSPLDPAAAATAAEKFDRYRVPQRFLDRFILASA